MKKTSWGSEVRRLGGVFLDTFFAKNIVLVQAIGLCPIIAIGINLKYGVALTLCTAAVLLPTSLCMSLWGTSLPAWLRPPVYTVGASVLLLGAAALVNQYISHELYAALYLYLPLMAVNTIFTYRAGGFSVTNRPVAALVDAAGPLWGLAWRSVSCPPCGKWPPAARCGISLSVLPCGFPKRWSLLPVSSCSASWRPSLNG